MITAIQSDCHIDDVQLKEDNCYHKKQEDLNELNLTLLFTYFSF